MPHGHGLTDFLYQLGLGRIEITFSPHLVLGSIVAQHEKRNQQITSWIEKAAVSTTRIFRTIANHYGDSLGVCGIDTEIVGHVAQLIRRPGQRMPTPYIRDVDETVSLSRHHTLSSMQTGQRGDPLGRRRHALFLECEPCFGRIV
jgi:hypothetical protein